MEEFTHAMCIKQDKNGSETSALCKKVCFWFACSEFLKLK